MRTYLIRDDDGVQSIATEDELYTAFCKIITNLLKNYSDAELRAYREDLASIAVYECLKAMRSYKPIGSVYAYARTVAQHKLNKEVKNIRKYNGMVTPLTAEHADSLVTEDCEPPNEELLAWIDKLKRLLDPEELEVVNLALQGYNNSDICLALKGERKQGSYVSSIWKRIRAKAITIGNPLRPIEEDDKV